MKNSVLQNDIISVLGHSFSCVCIDPYHISLLPDLMSLICSRVVSIDQTLETNFVGTQGNS